eukprot:13543885-Alexandrium_andersonii.AAC.1
METQAMVREQDLQGMYFLRKDVKGRRRRDPGWMERGMEEGRVWEVEGGVECVEARGKQRKGRTSWTTNYRGIAERLDSMREER